MCKSKGKGEKGVGKAEQATAAGGGSRELAKGRNKEEFRQRSMRKATIFLTVFYRGKT